MFGAGTLDLHHHLLDLAEAMRPLPATVSLLASVVADGTSQLDEVASVLRDDPSLVVALLREANSAASAPVSEIVTVEAAIMRLGTARVLAIAMGSVLEAEAQQPLAAYDLAPGELWRHSTTCSYVAEAIYWTSPKVVGAEVVTAALLHDIGQIVLDNVLDREHFALARANDLPVTAAERELIEVDHAELGAMLLELWEIPRSITDAVRFHHDPDASPGDLPAAHVVCVANHLTHKTIEQGCDETDFDEAADAQLMASLEVLNLDRDAVVKRATKLLMKAGIINEDDDY